MRADQITRVLKLVKLLKGNGRTLEQLRVELGVTKRTVQRDIHVLEQVGFPIRSVQRNRSVYWTIGYDPVSESAVSLTDDERMALYFSRELLTMSAGTPFFEAGQSAFAKIGASISPGVHGLLKSFEGQVAIAPFGKKNYSDSVDVITDLTRAIRHHFTVTVLHATPKYQTAVEYRLDPYRLLYHQGGLYLVALDQKKQEIRTFAVERIRSVATTPIRFVPPKRASLDEQQSTAFQLVQGEPRLVRIWFSKEQSPYIIERLWHPSQQIEHLPNGEIILSMRVAGLWEVKRWLYGWGSDAVILEISLAER